MKPVFFLMGLLLSLSSCISEFDFETGEPPSILVVDGRITTNSDQQTLSLSSVTEYGNLKPTPITGAAIRLFDDQGFLAHYSEIPDVPGTYLIPGLEGKVGRMYHLEIQLADERIYHSSPEPLLPVPKADSLSYATDFEFFQDGSGTVQQKWFMNVSVHTGLSPQREGPYLRWEVQTVYTFVEIPHPFPPPRPTVCYITETNLPQQIQLYDGSDIQTPKSITQRVGQRRIDWVLDWKHYFNVFQSSLSEQAYRYWSNVEKISNQSGTIFDPPPAPIRGNIYNTDNEQEVVLGYFGASAIDTVRVVSRGGDFFDFGIIPICGNTLIRPFPLPDACRNCIILPNSSYDRPDYF